MKNILILVECSFLLFCCQNNGIDSYSWKDRNNKNTISEFNMFSTNDNSIQFNSFTLQSNATILPTDTNDVNLTERAIDIIQSGSKIEILAKSNSNYKSDEQNYLVRISNSSKKWLGWISGSNKIFPKVNSETLIYIPMLSLSPNNNYLVYDDKQQNKIYISNKLNSQQHVFSYSGCVENSSRDADNVPGFFPLGWSEDEKICWIQVNYGEIAESFCCINTNDFSFYEANAPYNFNNYHYYFDIETGDCLYVGESNSTIKNKNCEVKNGYFLYRFNVMKNNPQELSFSETDNYKLLIENKKLVWYQEK